MSGQTIYSYVNGNPVSRIDPLGLWGSESHETIIRAAFPGLPERSIQQIIAGSQYVDRLTNQIGDPAEHAMRKPGESAAAAKGRMCKFVNGRLNDFRRFSGSQNPLGQLFAYQMLGQAMHPIMDSTSPAHKGFQEWHVSDSLSHGNFSLSIESEDHLTPMALDETVQLMNSVMKNGCSCE